VSYEATYSFYILNKDRNLTAIYEDIDKESEKEAETKHYIWVKTKVNCIKKKP